MRTLVDANIIIIRSKDNPNQVTSHKHTYLTPPRIIALKKSIFALQLVKTVALICSVIYWRFFLANWFKLIWHEYKLNLSHITAGKVKALEQKKNHLEDNGTSLTAYTSESYI
jgi:hypothetical protein